jgi:hypothetical protein
MDQEGCDGCLTQTPVRSAPRQWPQVYRPREHPEGQPPRASYENLQTRSELDSTRPTPPFLVASRASYGEADRGADVTFRRPDASTSFLQCRDSTRAATMQQNLIRPPRPPRVASEFPVSLSMASELLFNDGPTRRDAPL